MHFGTYPTWQVKNPVFSAFEDPEQPALLWQAVEMRLSTYYYLVHVKLDSIEKVARCTTILCVTVQDALDFLRAYPGSTISIMVPEWLNDGEPGLYRVTAIHQSVDPSAQPHIAECANGKMFILQIDLYSQRIIPNTVEKVTLWTEPRKVN